MDMIRRSAIAWLIVMLLSAAETGSAQSSASEYCQYTNVAVNRTSVAEWSTWLGLGGGKRFTGDERGRFGLRIGGTVDFPLARLGRRGRYGGSFEFRTGPYVQAETTIDAQLFEGGVTLDFSQYKHAQWGTFAIRGGGGVALRQSEARGTPDRLVPFGSITLTYGVRSTWGRTVSFLMCERDIDNEFREATGPRAGNGYASGARLYGTVRVDRDGVVSVMFGVEIEPSFFFPPYSLIRMIGARPRR